MAEFIMLPPIITNGLE